MGRAVRRVESSDVLCRLVETGSEDSRKMRAEVDCSKHQQPEVISR